MIKVEFDKETKSLKGWESLYALLDASMPKPEINEPSVINRFLTRDEFTVSQISET